MKRVKSACILQTLVFSQKPELNLSKEKELELNRAEFDSYVKKLKQTRTRHEITSVTEDENGYITVRVKKQYNDKIDVTEYFG